MVSVIAIPALTVVQPAYAAYTYGSVMFTKSGANTSYNSTNAANYAKAHATYSTRNTNYTDYGSNSDGGDCTNFASQILHDGGGLPFYGTKGNNAFTVDLYYYGPNVATSSNLNGRTPSWTGAHQYRTFWGTLTVGMDDTIIQ